MSNAISINPETFVESSGLLDDCDVVVKEASFDVFDYNGKVVPGIPALKIVMEVEGEDEATQYYSVGNLKDWMPSEDGSQLLAVGKATGISASSNGGIFLKSLFDVGFPADKLGDDITVLNGMGIHVIRVPAPKRPGIKKANDKGYDDTILVVGEILTLPWENEKGKKKKSSPVKEKVSAKKGKAKGKKKEEESGDLEESAVSMILEILAEEDSITRKELPAKIYQVGKDNPDRNAIVKLVLDEKFLADGPWDYEDGVLSSD